MLFFIFTPYKSLRTKKFKLFLKKFIQKIIIYTKLLFENYKKNSKNKSFNDFKKWIIFKKGLNA